MNDERELAYGGFFVSKTNTAFQMHELPDGTYLYEKAEVLNRAPGKTEYKEWIRIDKETYDINLAPINKLLASLLDEGVQRPRARKEF